MHTTWYSYEILNTGVVGLTAALKFQEQGSYRVTIIAETFPSDPKNIRYTSPWAGAHHVSSAGHDKRLQSACCSVLTRNRITMCIGRVGYGYFRSDVEYVCSWRQSGGLFPSP